MVVETDHPSEMTHAWLIIAHNEFGILQRLVSALDATLSDIYVHIDRKVRTLPILHTEHSRLFMLADRVDVRWGTVSQIQSEYALFEAASANGPYDFYHIISGTTLPLKPWPEIQSYFVRNAGHCILSGFCQSGSYQETLKLRRHNLFLRNYASPRLLPRKMSQFLWRSALLIQRIFGIETNRGKVFYKASNWLSLTEEAVQLLVARKMEILHTFRHTFCGDEYFVPSVLMASPLKSTLVSDDHYLLHNIARSNAGVFHLANYDELCKTEYLFARKFTER